MNEKSALILGASGLIGGHCLKYLLDDEYYTRIEALVRQPLSIEHPKLIQHQVNFDQLDKSLNKINANDVFCCLGSTIKKAGSRKAFYKVDFTYSSQIAKLSINNAGAEQFFLVSALGANPNSLIFYNRVKGELEQAIEKCNYKKFCIFRPSLLLGKRKEKRPSEEFMQNTSQLFSFGFKSFLKKYKPIYANVVAYVMVQIAKNNDPGKHIFESIDIQNIYDKNPI